MDKYLYKILDKYFNQLRSYINVLNVNIGEEITKGKRTGRQAIVVYVSRKIAVSKLRERDRLPDYIEKIPIDVVLFSPDYNIGDTKPSRMNPKEKKHIANGVKKIGPK